MTEKRYSRMTNHYGTSRTYCTGVYDNQNNRELKNASQVITELNALHEENQQLKKQLESEHTMLDNAILLERTRMGQSALKQYKEAIQ